jgi:hypothetical protein
MKKIAIFAPLISILALLPNNASVPVLLTLSVKLALNVTRDANIATAINLWTVYNAKINPNKECMPHSGFSVVFATLTLVFIWIQKQKTILSVTPDASLVLILQILALIVHLERLIEVMEGSVYLNVLSDMCLMKIVLGIIYVKLMNRKH